ncbi:MAG: hypothetical protein A3H69_05040 [Candidatus Sungbacteria bacterium RIFCSPLOWO2_02_FULL_47_9]|nr:MAG: hypothetical protein A3H69_05040 [Candidatus Sungbacteria bacterium RIFCSPLOWO2_02_FULL_47_9]
MLKPFLSWSFFHYLWTGGVLALVQICLLWLFIDIFHISTIISSITIIGGLFIMRFLMLRFFNVVG